MGVINNFSGSRISLSLSRAGDSGFLRNIGPRSIRYWKFARQVGCEKQLSGLRD